MGKVVGRMSRGADHGIVFPGAQQRERQLRGAGAVASGEGGVADEGGRPRTRQEVSVRSVRWVAHNSKHFKRVNQVKRPATSSPAPVF